MSNYNRVNRVLIGDGANVSAITELSGIQKGDLVFIDEKNNIIANATGAGGADTLARFERITLAVGTGPGEAILSSPIQGNTVSKYEGVKYVAPSEMVAILGYNGSASTGISIAAEEEYRLRVLIKDDQRVHGQRMSLADVNYQASATDTAATVAYKIAHLFYQTDYSHNYMNDKVKLERVADGTFNASDNDVTVTNGSKTITFATAAEHSTGTPFAVGDDIRIGGTGAQEAVYTITAVDGLNITLDTAYQGANATVAAANVGQLAGATEWGFKLTGIAQDSKISRAANEPLDQYEWILFDAVFTNADDLASSQYSADYTLVQSVNPGQGFWKQVADIEEAAKGYLGDTSKRRYHDLRIDSNVIVGQSYDSIIISHTDVHGGDFQGTYSAPLKTEIYIPTGGTGQGDEADPAEFLGILNGYFNTVLGFPAIDLS
jgi:hypothetical protein